MASTPRIVATRWRSSLAAVSRVEEPPGIWALPEVTKPCVTWCDLR